MVIRGRKVRTLLRRRGEGEGKDGGWRKGQYFECSLALTLVTVDRTLAAALHYTRCRPNFATVQSNANG